VYRIGLTGGIASGKSAAGAILRGLGAHVIVADDVARELVVPGRPVLTKIVEAFGEDVLLPDGALDRGRLASRVFGSAEGLASLNAIVHPPLVEAIIVEAEEVEREQGAGVLVVDAALLVDWDILDLFDSVVVVHAPRELRLARLVAGGRSPAEAEARMASQASEDEFLEAADVVIENNGTLPELEEKVVHFWHLLPNGVRKNS
jgi:dephospho-CoA kinase